MAHTKNSKVKGKKRPRPRQGGHGLAPGIQRVPAPKVRLKPVLKVLGDAAAAGDRALASIPDTHNPLVSFDAGVLLRGINAVKSVLRLLECSHWENATAVTRQLFELLINMEFLATFENREEGMVRYCRFGLLQAVQEQHREILYEQKTGRAVDTDRLDHLDAMLASSFPEFRDVKPDGKITWKPSWSGKHAKALAELSSNPVRLDQYEQLFRSWSMQIHAMPGALIGTIFRDSDADWVTTAVAEDDKKIIELAAITLIIFLELWRQLPGTAALEPDQAMAWVAESRRFMIEGGSTSA